MPKIDLVTVPVRTGSGYPAEFAAPCADRTRRRIGHAGGLRDDDDVLLAARATLDQLLGPLAG